MTNSETTFSRPWQMIRYLSKSQLSIKELAEKMSCSTRTVQRNLVLFRELGILREETAGKKGAKTYRVVLHSPELSFNYDEVAAIYISRRFLEPMRGTTFWEAIQSAQKKMQAGLGTQMVRYVERSTGVIGNTTFGWGDYRNSVEIIDDLNLAIEENQSITILYQTLKDTQESTTSVDPYGIFFHGGSLYFVGFSHKRQQIQQWKVDRVHRLIVSNDKFQVRNNFNLSEYTKEMFAGFKASDDCPKRLVRIHFSSHTAKEKRWHPSQRMIDQPDGSVIMELTLAELEVVKYWVLGCGHHAEVLEPPELREMVRKEIDKMSAYYKHGSREQQHPDSY